MDTIRKLNENSKLQNLNISNCKIDAIVGEIYYGDQLCIDSRIKTFDFSNNMLKDKTAKIESKNEAPSSSPKRP